MRPPQRLWRVMQERRRARHKCTGESNPSLLGVQCRTVRSDGSNAFVELSESCLRRDTVPLPRTGFANDCLFEPTKKCLSRSHIC